ncbi:hypothetical protein M409DRAFT_21450 [Zasmidium cellare ATCC 36951]|uniref:Uncharacterized protein n=1 Tax=Zasmidium cellare ATCC 36951 TaxID=1080233 RepID=A0A6A6CMZ9_ZASCE|nr:uncharacterized protein M409DRAFT_21450 [Zasmidium cellare ATCC 36951]KAF2168003.1 hypothetical protein M409DRAFT_21450 [Zasmidium cellare ATCC 36951]
MQVPRSFKYSSSPPMADALHERPARRSPTRKPKPDVNVTSRPVSPARTESEPVAIPSPKSTNAPAFEPSPADQSHEMPNYRSQTLPIGRRKPSSAHDPNALPPAVAALLAVTAIPPRKPNRYRRRPGSDRRISIEELIQEWKSDSSLKSTSYGSPALNVLLEDTDCEDEDSERRDSGPDPAFLNARSASSESMPSLEADDRSVLSVGSPSTPGSLRSRKSYQNLKSRPRSLPTVEDCAFDHPLVPRSVPEDDDFLLPVQKQSVSAAKPRSSFKSNLTASLQSLKKAAVESISSIGRASSSPALSRHATPPIDDMLWSHPFLFPRFSSEIRPTVDGTPSEAERRYLNPIPLTFEEQEAPFQQALHAPFLAEAIEDAPTIQLQTYNRGRRRGSPKRAPNPNSEAGRALLGATGVRQREVRENPDFLRIVVMEMNMRREGKLEQGRAKIWLPPREASPAPETTERVPRRWVGVSAY